MATKQQTTFNKLPGFILDPYKRMLQGAEKLYTEPFIKYGEPSIAPLSSLQQKGLSLTNKAAGASIPLLNQAIGLTQNYAAPVSGSDINRYMNPYHKEVTSNIIEELMRQNDIESKNDLMRAGQLNAFGNSRLGLVESERERNFQNTLGDVLAQRYEGAYESGLNTALEEKRLGQGAAAQLGKQAQDLQGMYGTDIASLLSGGALQQEQTQASLTQAKEDFLEQRQYPYGQINWFNSLLTGSNPGTQSATSTVFSPGPSKTAGILGNILGIGGTLFGGGSNSLINSIGDFFGGLF